MWNSRRHTAAMENHLVELPKARARAKPSTAAIRERTAPKTNMPKIRGNGVNIFPASLRFGIFATQTSI